MFRMTYTLLLLMTLFSCKSPAGDIYLVENGVARSVIVVPEGATRNEQRAAAILQENVKSMTGATLNIIPEGKHQLEPAIFIGNTGHADKYNTGRLKNEGFFIASDNRNLYIKGGGGKGVIYGVCTLLENYFGC